ncbi:short-subunit dehydrogenase [Ciceribacter lividus]|uniref:Short-subunit dehydrogenase n=1 Tax=Ciceribacter lividus TaxID=1197950 RepID=A0A6I7HSX4_9HYPH|nr:oxidoreductase [Ciceribacter lividus]RCW27892.1 short-subunit dehydrogenase [Ciceribacter lividus]
MSNYTPVALVTGASGGIGFETAKALRSAGYTVFGTSRRASEGASIDGISLLPCDVTDDASVAALVTQLVEKAGRIDVLVNNAGGALIAAAEESSVDQAKALFDLNVFGVIRMTNAVLPIMRSQRSGRIINIGSVVGFVPSPFSALYAATKHAVEGYSQSLDHEVRNLGIRVLLIEPAFTRTSLDHNATGPDRKLAVYDEQRNAMVGVWQQAIKTGDPPQVVAGAVVAAVSDKKPKLQNPATKMARQLFLLRRLVPANAFDKSLRKHMKLRA